MKRKILTVILSIVFALTATAQIHNVSVYSIANASTSFGRNLPAGTIIRDASTDNIYMLTSSALSTATLSGTTAKIDVAGDWLKVTNKGSAYSNVFLGDYSGDNNTTGHENTAVGYYTMQNNTTGHFNTVIGNKALQYNSSGSGNCAFGYYTLWSNTSGRYNMGFGNSALCNNTTGDRNTAIGTASLFKLSSGSYNTAIGDQAGEYYGSSSNYLTTANSSTYIGYMSKASANNISNETVIGANTVTVGDENVTDIYLNQDTTAYLHTGSIIPNGDIVSTKSYSSPTFSFSETTIPCSDRDYDNYQWVKISGNHTDKFYEGGKVKIYAENFESEEVYDLDSVSYSSSENKTYLATDDEFYILEDEFGDEAVSWPSVKLASSIVFGQNNYSSGTCNFVTGENDSLFAESDYNIVNGYYNSLNGADYSIVSGRNNSINYSSEYLSVFGENNSLENYNSFLGVSGRYNKIQGSQSCFIQGQSNKLINSNYSIVSGYNNSDTNIYRCLVLGDINSVSQNPTRTIVSGYNNNVTGAVNSVVFGKENTIGRIEQGFVSGYKNIANNSEANNYNSVIIGEWNESYGSKNVLLGRKNIAHSYECFLLGRSNTTTKNLVFALGAYNTISEGNSYVIGFSNTIQAKSFVIGTYNTISNNNPAGVHNYVIGAHDTIKGDAIESVIAGAYSSTDGSRDFVSGYKNVLSSSYGQNFVGGYQNILSSGCFADIVAGEANEVNSTQRAAVFGSNNEVDNATYSLTAGYKLINKTISSIKVGYCNIGIDSAILEIGNGSSPSVRSNALTLYQNGDLELSGGIVLDETTTPVEGALSYKDGEFRGYNGLEWLNLEDKYNNSVSFLKILNTKTISVTGTYQTITGYDYSKSYNLVGDKTNGSITLINEENSIYNVIITGTATVTGDASPRYIYFDLYNTTDGASEGEYIWVVNSNVTTLSKSFTVPIENAQNDSYVIRIKSNVNISLDINELVFEIQKIH